MTTPTDNPAWLLELPLIQETMRKHSCSASVARDLLAEHDIDCWGNDVVGVAEEDDDGE